MGANQQTNTQSAQSQSATQHLLAPKQLSSSSSFNYIDTASSRPFEGGRDQMKHQSNQSSRTRSSASGASGLQADKASSSPAHYGNEFDELASASLSKQSNGKNLPISLDPLTNHLSVHAYARVCALSLFVHRSPMQPIAVPLPPAIAHTHYLLNSVGVRPAIMNALTQTRTSRHNIDHHTDIARKQNLAQPPRRCKNARKQNKSPHDWT